MKEIKILKEDSNQRIDKFIKKEFKNIPLSFLYKTFRKKDIKINGKHVKEDYLLEENDILSIYIDDKKLEEFKKESSFSESIENINLDIVYEDKNLLIINKDRGLLVHGDKNEKRYTLSNYVLNYLSKKGEFDSKRDNFIPSPTHRIDRNTSGIIVFAKNYLASKELCQAFKDKNKILKEYIALSKGVTPEEFIIDKPLYKVSKNNEVFVDYEKGQKAITKVVKLLGDSSYSLLKITLLTGRTHQIRVHLKSEGYPIIGDEKYGDFELNKLINKKYGFYKQFLHSYLISFSNFDGFFSYLNNKSFKAELKKDETMLLSKLKFKVEL